MPRFLSWQQWGAQIGLQSSFGDARLSARLARILPVLGPRHFDSIPQAFNDQHQAKALYRFVGNKKVIPSNVMNSFSKFTVQQSVGMCELCIAHDTTSINYAGLTMTEGLGPTNDKESLGLHVHSSLVIGEDDLPIGLTSQQCWARHKTERVKHLRAKRPIEDKESFKWIQGVRETREAFSTLAKAARPRLIHLMDREGDVREVFYEIQKFQESAVIRCLHNRKVEGEMAKAHELVAQQKSLGSMQVDVPRKHNQKARFAKVELRSVKITLPVAKKKGEAGATLEVGLVELREPNPPEGEKGLHWLLWTFEPFETFDQARRVCELYLKRWRIEELHFVLKSGCGIEKLQFDHVDDLKIMLAIYTSIAVRIVRLRDRMKTTPEVSFEVEFTEEEYQALYLNKYRKPPPPNHPPPTLREVMLLVGGLGGHMGRKGDGLPGVKTLWRGMRDLEMLLQGFRLARQLDELRK